VLRYNELLARRVALLNSRVRAARGGWAASGLPAGGLLWLGGLDRALLVPRERTDIGLVPVTPVPESLAARAPFLLRRRYHLDGTHLGPAYVELLERSLRAAAAGSS